MASIALLAPGASHAFGPVNVKLTDIAVTKVPCGAGISTVRGVTFSGSSSSAACLDIVASANNPSDKPVYNADVFGRVYDANGDALIDDTENIRIAYIDEVPAGNSQVKFRLTVPEEQYKMGPLKLERFKATGFAGKNLPGQGSGVIAANNEDCEITGDCDSEENLIR